MMLTNKYIALIDQVFQCFTLMVFSMFIRFYFHLGGSPLLPLSQF